MVDVTSAADLVAPLWVPDPDRVRVSQLAEFASMAGDRTRTDLSDYHALQRWSVEDLSGFWRCVWDYFDVIGAGDHTEVLAVDRMPGAVWFPGVRLNLVDQVFRQRDLSGVAITELDEFGTRREISWDELHTAVAAVAARLKALGVGVGDRVIAYLPNCAEAVIAFLGTAAVGAIWSACGMEYAPTAALSRFHQLSPRVLFAADGYINGGRTYDRTDAVAALRDGLPSLIATVAVPRLGQGLPDAGAWADVITHEADLQTTPVPFDHPLWVLFSSGTTGMPKGIVHGHGGVLLEHLKSLGLLADLRAGERFWWYTSPSWMMWNYQVAGLLVGATIICYDGSPAYPATNALWQVAARLRVDVLGTSPAYIAACSKAGMHPAVEHDLTALRMLGVTGSTLPSASYYWIADNVGRRVQIASITGGTDVVTAFAGSAPNLPVWAGEISGACLGVALDAYDEHGKSLRGSVGELVVTRPMPSMPVTFWNDPDGSRLQEAYFAQYPGIWRHGDWVTLTDRGSVIMHGRSDATLNRKGIRMGSSDIYAAVERIPAVTESLVLGIEEADGGYWMPLFVVLREGCQLDDGVCDRIRRAIREHASSRHLPDDIIAAPGIPHTRTGKKLEVPLKRMMQEESPDMVFDADSVDAPDLVSWYIDIARDRREKRSK